MRAEGPDNMCAEGVCMLSMSAHIPVFTNEEETESVVAIVDAQYHAELSKSTWFLSRSGLAVRDSELVGITTCSPYESMGHVVLVLSGRWPRNERGEMEPEDPHGDDWSLYPEWVDVDEFSHDDDFQ